MTNRNERSISPGRLIVILLILLVFAAAAFVLIRSSIRSQAAGIHTQRKETRVSVEGPAAEAYYTLSAYSLGSQDVAEAETGTVNHQSWYLLFQGDGTGVACILDQGPSPFTYTDDALVFEDGSSLRYEIEGSTLTLYSGATLIFTRGVQPAGASAAADIPAAADMSPAAADTARIPPESTWYGVLEIHSHSGKGSLSEGGRNVWGIIGSAEEGQTFFELYDVADYDLDDLPILSMWIRLEGDHFVPLIGEEDAWIFDRWLDPGDVDDFTLYLEDESLSASYRYVYGKEKCTIQFTVSLDD